MCTIPSETDDADDALNTSLMNVKPRRAKPTHAQVRRSHSRCVDPRS